MSDTTNSAPAVSVQAPLAPKKNPFGAYRMDARLMAEGVWVDGFRNGVEMLVCSVASKAAKTHDAETIKRQRNLYASNSGFLPPEIVKANNIARATSVLVKGWRLNEEAAKEYTLPAFSKEALTEVLTDPELGEGVLNDILFAAQSEDAFKPQGPKPTDAATAKALEGN